MNFKNFPNVELAWSYYEFKLKQAKAKLKTSSRELKVVDSTVERIE